MSQREGSEKSFLDKVLGKTIDSLFDIKKLRILLIAFAGFILRIIAARNLSVHPDDVNHALWALGIFNSNKLVIWGQSTALWYYVQGVFYAFFGPTMIGSRFAEAVFGTVSIFAIFLFVKRVFKSEKAALISSILVAFSPMLIKNTLPEMDIAAAFFIIMSAYFLFGYKESHSKKSLLLSALFIGVGIMIKLYVAFFAVSYFIFLFFLERRSGRSRKSFVKRLFTFACIVAVLVIPTLAHNYLLYKDKGFMDLIFTNTFRLGLDKAKQYYAWGAGWLPYSDYKGFFLGNQENFAPTALPGFVVMLLELFKGDPLLIILGFCGLVLTYKKHRDYFWFFLLTSLPAFIYLGAQIPMSKHFIWIFYLLAPCAGLLLESVNSRLPSLRVRYIAAVIIIFSLFYLGMSQVAGTSHFYAESAFGQLVDYRQGISNNALVVADSRIYRGYIHWALAGTNYVEASQFFSAAQQANAAGNVQSVEVYYVECVVDDCGWGTVAGQPDFNKSMEQITEFFANRSTFSADFAAPDVHDYYVPFFGEKHVEYRIYKTTLGLNPALLSAVKQTHNWFLFPIGYDRDSGGPIFDDFNTSPGLDTLLYKFAWFIFYLELCFSLGAIIYIVFLFLNE